MIEGYIGKNTNQCNMNKNVLVSYTKTNKSHDKNKIQNENNLKNQRIAENILKTSIISYNTQIDKVQNQNPDLINKYQHCQKNVEIEKTQANLDDLNTKDSEESKKEKKTEERHSFVTYVICIGGFITLVISFIIHCVYKFVRWWRNRRRRRNEPEEAKSSDEDEDFNIDDDSSGPVEESDFDVADINFDDTDSIFDTDSSPLPPPLPSEYPLDNEANLTAYFRRHGMLRDDRN
ncbi:hypothetical protein SLOPH_792 [Spraguea lophii 42_110]|uniref:Uncharacterized protein n=1 Tax=Spraguea lophii (strain 42_110) TaxID=1358809 RepID=S7XP12_SPRLO|nr:hypothetical protein SLOPH_792 [Spraguea lophii 42_110]